MENISFCIRKNNGKLRNRVEMFGFSNYSSKSRFYDDSNKLVIDKIKDGTGRVLTEEFVGFKPKMYLFLVENNSEHK